jgi:hypothetical protein
MTKLCQDCRWFIPGKHDIEWSTCGHPTSVYQSPPSVVTGRVFPPTKIPCESARAAFTGSSRCGQTAQHWEPPPGPGFT